MIIDMKIKRVTKFSIQSISTYTMGTFLFPYVNRLKVYVRIFGEVNGLCIWRLEEFDQALFESSDLVTGENSRFPRGYHHPRIAPLLNENLEIYMYGKASHDRSISIHGDKLFDNG